MKTQNRFGLALTLLISTAIVATPASSESNPQGQNVAQSSSKIKKVVTPSTQGQFENSILNEKIKVIKPGGIQGKDGDFKDTNPFAQGPTFGEGSPGFVNFTKPNSGSQKINPAEKVAPSAVQKFKTIGR